MLDKHRVENLINVRVTGGNHQCRVKFKCVERMDDYRMTRRVLMAEVSGGRVGGKPRLGWMDGVKVALGNRGMTVEAARRVESPSWYICN